MAGAGTRRKKRALGPGVMERPTPSKNDLYLTRDGLGRGGKSRRDAALETPDPIFDPELPVAHRGAAHSVGQVVVEANQTAVYDAVVPITREMRSWNCYARSARGKKWHGVAPVDDAEQHYAVSVGRSRLDVRGAAASPRDSEAGEVVWRWNVEHVGASRGTDLLVRFVVRLRRHSRASESGSRQT